VISEKETVSLKDNNNQVEKKLYVRNSNFSHEIKLIAVINDYMNTKFK